MISGGEFKNSEMINLYCATGYLLKYEYKFLGGSRPNSRRLQLFALGYLSHLIGDTYAHRTIVPTSISFISGSTPDGANFLSGDFNKISTLQSSIKQDTFEYRSLKGYAKNTTTMNSRYIDNTAFYSNRYANAQHCVTKELRRALKDKEETFTYTTFIQKSGYETNSKLSSLKRFATDCGGNTSAYTTSEWKKYSTSD